MEGEMKGRGWLDEVVTSLPAVTSVVDISSLPIQFVPLFQITTFVRLPQIPMPLSTLFAPRKRHLHLTQRHGYNQRETTRQRRSAVFIRSMFKMRIHHTVEQSLMNRGPRKDYIQERNRRSEIAEKQSAH